jgi:hypothetical protein
MADSASRAWHLSDDAFLNTFSNTYLLHKQLESWQLVKLPTETVSAHISILLQKPYDLRDWTARTGRTGQVSAPILDKACSTPQDQLPSWKDACCSWPLINASGRVDTTMHSRLAARKSRCADAPRYSRPMDIKTPVDLPPAKSTLTNRFKTCCAAAKRTTRQNVISPCPRQFSVFWRDPISAVAGPTARWSRSSN